MLQLLSKAKQIAASYEVMTAPNRAVVYSVSYMPDSHNKSAAQKLISSDSSYRMLDDTPCGKALIALGLEGKVDEVAEEITAIWKLASARYIAAASGNITAFVEGADERSTFCTTELAEILRNPKITHINGITKEDFAASFKPVRY